MSQSFFTVAISALEWTDKHLSVAIGVVVGLVVLDVFYRHIPKRLVYYWINGRVSLSCRGNRNSISQVVTGRLSVFLFCLEHNISMSFTRRISQSLLESLLLLILIPDPRKFAWEGWFAAMMFYPLGRNRREYIAICTKRRIWPWKREVTMRRILDKGNGCLPGLQSETALAALLNRVNM